MMYTIVANMHHYHRLNVVFSVYLNVNITFQHLFIIIKCPAELIFYCMMLIRSMPSTGVTE